MINGSLDDSQLDAIINKRMSRRAVLRDLAGLALAGGSLTSFATSCALESTAPAFVSTPRSLTSASPAEGVIPYTCHGHLRSVTAVAWSPDGTRIASASADKTVRIR